MLLRNNLAGREGHGAGRWQEPSRDAVSAGDVSQPDPMGSSGRELHHRESPRAKQGRLLGCGLPLGDGGGITSDQGSPHLTKDSCPESHASCEPSVASALSSWAVAGLVAGTGIWVGHQRQLATLTEKKFFFRLYVQGSKFPKYKKQQSEKSLPTRAPSYPQPLSRGSCCVYQLPLYPFRDGLHAYIL